MLLKHWKVYMKSNTIVGIDSHDISKKEKKDSEFHVRIQTHVIMCIWSC